MYYDPLQPRLLNFNSTNDLTIQFSRKEYGINEHNLVDIVSSHCYLSSSHDKRISLHVKENNGKMVLENAFEC